ncbi:MAG: glycosyltransferase family 4 protein [Cyanobacteria bacterium P01_G01_bin.19]
MKKPVLTIFYQYNPWASSIGGIQTVINSFIKYAPSNFELRMVGTCEDSSQVGEWQYLEYAGRKVSFFPIIAIKDDNIRHLIPTTVKYTAALLRLNLASDFMHFHRLEPTVAALKWKGNKTFFIHNDIEEKMNPADSRNKMLWAYFPAVYFALEKMLIQQFARIYSCNNKASKFYQQKYPNLSERITYLKNAVDTDIFHPLQAEQLLQKREELAKQLNLSINTKFILFAGRLHPQKDPVLLVKAFAALAEPDAHLLIVGDGELAEAVRSEVVACGLSKRVSLMGSLKQEQLFDLYCIASVFALSSVYEGLPIAVLEALACGTPIVTTNCGETPNLLTVQTGVVARERSPEAIAAALSQVLQNPAIYPAEDCVRVARPYTAKAVVRDVYQDMFDHWEAAKLPSSR